MTRLVPLVLAFLALPALARAVPADSTTGRSLVRAMHDRYAGVRPETITFVQRTIRYPAPAEADTTIWYEAGAPGMLRIDTDFAAGDGAIFRDGTLYVFKAGEKVAERPEVNPLALILMDLYAWPPERTTSVLDSLGYDLDTVHEDTWEGGPVWVVGAAPGDLESPQFWVEKERLLPVRILDRLPNDGPVLDARIEKFTPVNGAFVESRLAIHVAGKLYQTEEYTHLRTGIELPDGLFDPTSFRWTEPYWE